MLSKLSGTIKGFEEWYITYGLRSASQTIKIAKLSTNQGRAYLDLTQIFLTLKKGNIINLDGQAICINGHLVTQPTDHIIVNGEKIPIQQKE